MEFLQNKTLLLGGGLIMVSLFMIGLYYIYGYYSNAINSKNKYITNIDNNENSLKDATLYFFYTTWCPFSVSALPEWNRISEKYNGNDVNGYRINCISVDCTNETIEIESQMKKYNIEGFPTLKLIKDDHIVEFDAKVNYENMQDFIQSVL